MCRILDYVFSGHPGSNNTIITRFTNIIETCITANQNMALMCPVSDDEVWKAVNGIGALKSPRSDCIHASFYHKCWDVIGHSVISLVKYFFTNGSSLRLINHTNITVIPKVENPEIVSNFRPISLRNVTYKIITKLMVNRLKPILDTCISNN